MLRCGLSLLRCRRFLGTLVPRIGANSFVHNTATLVGAVEIGDNVAVLPTAVLRGDVNSISVGSNSNVQDGVIIHAGKDRPTKIGECVSIGHGARLHGCKVADRVLIGISAVVLDGSEIGEDSLIAAGALIPPRKKLPPGGLWVGRPAKRVRDLTPNELQGIRDNAAVYVELCGRYRRGEFGGH